MTYGMDIEVIVMFPCICLELGLGMTSMKIISLGSLICNCLALHNMIMPIYLENYISSSVLLGVPSKLKCNKSLKH